MHSITDIEIYQQARTLLARYIAATTAEECRQIANEARAFTEERPVRSSTILLALADDAMYAAAMFEREKC